MRRLVHAENLELATLPKPRPPQKTTGQKVLKVVKYFPIAGLIIRLLSDGDVRQSFSLSRCEYELIHAIAIII